LLLTTRAGVLRRFGFAQPIELTLFDVEQGALFLLRRSGLLRSPDATLEQASPSDQEHTKQISKELGGLPLALDQAGAYLEATSTDLETYQRLYEQHRMELLKERRGGQPEDHPQPVAATLLLSFEWVEQRNVVAADLLQLCAYLAP